jgi:hypothetical protein
VNNINPRAGGMVRGAAFATAIGVFLFHASSAGAEESRTITGRGSFGCKDAQTFAGLLQLAIVQQDKAAFSRRLSVARRRGECVVFDYGQPVTVIFQDGTFAHIKYRGQSYYTAAVAIGE